MKQGIHPKWYPNAQVVCACGNSWTTGSTQPVIRTDVCSHCHPFYTGEQRIVDTAGQVERFMKRLERTETGRGDGAEGEQKGKVKKGTANRRLAARRKPVEEPFAAEPAPDATAEAIAENRPEYE
jgi:large subunit ribosomal protein L31